MSRPATPVPPQSPERRVHPRFNHPELEASLRLRGVPWGRQVETLDYNRYGAALRVTKPVDDGAEVYVGFALPGTSVPEVKARVQGCTPWHGAFRIGLQFTPDAESAHDRAVLVAALLRLELRIAHARGAATEVPERPAQETPVTT